MRPKAVVGWLTHTSRLGLAGAEGFPVPSPLGSSGGGAEEVGAADGEMARRVAFSTHLGHLKVSWNPKMR